jgi:2-amino-4-hydroxy-6-hydroxymethyldihydropteridine diphosphokinase
MERRRRCGVEKVTVLLGLGANLGDPAAQLEEALRSLGESMRITGVSSAYRTQPVGFLEQPDFLNAVCRVEWEGTAAELLALTQRIEHRLGRVRSVRNAPRSIDIDLLDFGGLVLETEGLRLPHPGIPRRAFVLTPLAELAPDWRHPELDLTAGELLDAAGPLERVERVGPLGWRESHRG